MKIDIKHRYNGSVLFSHECEWNTLKTTLVMALRVVVNMGCAKLTEADLSDANLSGAYLSHAYLRKANLSGANLRGADLRMADLRDAFLCGADLRGADIGESNLHGAHIDGGRKLIGDRPVLQVGPIGSRGDWLIAFITDGGVMIRAGCFFGSKRDFEEKVRNTHDDGPHGREYAAAISLINAHVKIWTPERSSWTE